MRTLSLLIATLLATGPALAASNNSDYGIVNGYDYIPGTDIYRQNYDYGLHYDRLTSLPENDSNPYDIPKDNIAQSGASKTKLHALKGKTPGSQGAGAASGGDRFSNMDAELQRFQAQNLAGAESMDTGAYETLNQSLKKSLKSRSNGGGQNAIGGGLLPDPYSDLNLESDLHKDLGKLNRQQGH